MEIDLETASLENQWVLLLAPRFRVNYKIALITLKKASNMLGRLPTLLVSNLGLLQRDSFTPWWSTLTERERVGCLIVRSREITKQRGKERDLYVHLPKWRGIDGRHLAMVSVAIWVLPTTYGDQRWQKPKDEALCEMLSCEMKMGNVILRQNKRAHQK